MAKMTLLSILPWKNELLWSLANGEASLLLQGNSIILQRCVAIKAYYCIFFFIQDIYYYNYKELLKKKIITKF